MLHLSFSGYEEAEWTKPVNGGRVLVPRAVWAVVPCGVGALGRAAAAGRRPQPATDRRGACDDLLCLCGVQFLGGAAVHAEAHLICSPRAERLDGDELLSQRQTLDTGTWRLMPRYAGPLCQTSCRFYRFLF